MDSSLLTSPQLSPLASRQGRSFSALFQSPKTLQEQLKNASEIGNSDRIGIEDLVKATHGNKRYVLEEQISRKDAKGRRSWIKNHGIFLYEISLDNKPLH